MNVTRYTRSWTESKVDRRRKPPTRYRKVYDVWPRVYGPWLDCPKAAKAWLPDELKGMTQESAEPPVPSV